MATYADWAASRQPASADQGSSTPVKLVIDGQGNVFHAAPSTSLSTGSMIEEAPMHMSVDDQQEVVQNIRTKQRSNETVDYRGSQLYHAATVNEEQRAWSSRSISPSTILLVVDTNWLLSHLTLFVQIEQLVAHHVSAFAPVLFILPSIVLRELDGLKHSDAQSTRDSSVLSKHTPAIGHLSRTASTFILEKLTHRPDLFRGQKADERSIQGAEQAMKSNDEQVLDCCTYFQKQGYQVGLLSDDKILCSQATIAGLPYMNFAPEYDNPETFFSRLHPDLPPYLQKLKTATMNGSHDVVPSPPGMATGFTLETFTTKASLVQNNLLAQQMSAIAHLEHNFPLMPPDLLEVVSVVTSSLLAPVIFPVLLHHLANNNLEIFAYMLARSSIFRDFRPMSSKKEEEILDCTRWNATICLKLMNQNWQECFADKVGRVNAASTAGNGDSLTNFTFSNKPQSSTSGGSGSSLSSSRWASNSASSYSPKRNFSSSSSQSTSATTFHPSKLSALATAFASPSEDILRWTSARWRLVLEDLELLLCSTAVLSDVPDSKQKAELLLKAARKNVDTWKAT